jgi:hypothetical protein
MKTLLAVALLLIGAYVQEVGEGDRKTALRQFAQRTINEKTVNVLTPTYDTSGVYMKYDLGGWAVTYVDKGQPFDQVLGEVLQVAVIRSDTSPISKKWLVPALDRVEDIIEQMIADLQQPGMDKTKLSRSLKSKSDQILSIYKQQMKLAAKALGKREFVADPNAPGREDMPEAGKQYKVSFVTEPLGGAIKYLPAGRWELYKFLSKDRKDVAEPEWIALVQTNAIQLGGKYRFRVNWPAGKPFEGTVEINKNDTLRFPQP